MAMRLCKLQTMILILAILLLPALVVAEEEEDTAASIPVQLTWSAVAQMLQPNMSYMVTDILDGVTFRMTCISVDHHAEMSCATVWDQATCALFFAEDQAYARRAVTVHIHGLDIAASLSCVPAMDGISAPSGYCLYFSEALSGVGALPDAEHDFLIRSISDNP